MMNAGHASEETRRYGRSAAQLTGVLGLVGVLTYVFFALCSHSLDKDQYGEIVVLWSVVFLLSSTLFRPIEQLLSRTLAEQEQAGTEHRTALAAAAKIQAGLCLLAIVALVIARKPIEDELFSGDELFYWSMIGSLIGFGVAYYARGFLAGRRQFTYYAALLLVEVVLRLILTAIVAFGIAGGAGLIAVGIAVAPVGCLVVLPLAIRRRGIDEAAVPGSASPQAGSTELTLGSGGAFAGAVLLMMLSEQVLVSSGALFVRAAEGAAAAGFIFNVLLIARAPLVLFQAVAASLLPHLTRLRARGDESSQDAFKSSLESTMLLIAGFALVTTLAVLAVGPPVMQIAFGDKFEYDRLGMAVVAVGMGFYLVAASLNQATLAQGQAHRAASRWVFCALAFVVYNLIGPADSYRAVEVGFAGSAALLSVLLYLVYADPHPNPSDSLEPGSPRETQAILAASDEIG